MNIDITKGVDLTTPAGTLRWPYLQKPQTNFNPEGTFTTKIVFLPGEFEPFEKKLDELYNKNLEVQASKNQGKKIAKAKKPWGPELDKDDNPTGNVSLTVKSNAKRGTYDFRPKLFNADGTPFDSATAAIGSGTTAKLGVRARGWYVKGEAGISVGIEAAQILKLVRAGKNSAEDYGFSKESMPQDESSGEGQEY